MCLSLPDAIGFDTSMPVLTTGDIGADGIPDVEGATYTFYVERSGTLTGTVTARWAVTGSGANPANALDFDGGVFPSGTISFAPGQSHGVITVHSVDDVVPERTEQFLVSLFSPSQGATISVATQVANITDDDPLWPMGLLTVALQSGGNWSLPNASGNSRYTGTIRVSYGSGPAVLEVVGTVSRQQNALVFASDAVATALVGGLTSPIIVGQFRLNYGNAATGTLNQTQSFVAGFPMQVSQIALGAGGVVTLGYDLPLSGGFPDLSAQSAIDPNAIVLSSAGVQLGQAGTIEIPTNVANFHIRNWFPADLSGLTAYGFNDEATGAVSDIRVSGTMSFTSPLRTLLGSGGTRITADFSAPDSYLDFNNLAPGSVDFKGTLKIDHEFQLAEGWKLTSVELGVDPANGNEISIAGDLQTPFKVKLGLKNAIKATSTLGIGATIDVITTPSLEFNGIGLAGKLDPGLPIPETRFLLTGLNANMTNIAPDAVNPFTISGGLDLSYLSIIPGWTPLTMNVQGTLDSPSKRSVSMSGTLFPYGDLALGTVTSQLEMDWANGLFYSSAGTVAIGKGLLTNTDLFDGSASISVSMTGINVSATGSFAEPALVSRKVSFMGYSVDVPALMVRRSESATFSVNYLYSQPLASQSAVLLASYAGNGQHYTTGWRIALDLSSVSRIGMVPANTGGPTLLAAPHSLTAAAAQDVTTSVSPAYTVDPGTSKLFLTADWTGTPSNAPAPMVVTPDGSTISAAGFAAAGIIELTDLEGPGTSVLMVDAPMSGVWHMQFADAAALGTISYDGEVSVAQQTLDLAGPVALPSGGYSLGWNASGYAAGATITFFASTDAGTSTGQPISSPLPAADSGQFSWSGDGVTPGEYYVFAELDGGNAIPVTATVGSNPLTVDVHAYLTVTVTNDAIVRDTDGNFVTTVTLDVANIGPDAASDVDVLLQLPDEFLPHGGQAGVTQVGADWSVAVGTVAPGTTAALAIALDASGSSLSVGQHVLFTATVTSDTHNANASANNVVLAADVACFASATRLRTTRGDVAVENLHEGDSLLTRSGPRPIVWIGRRRIDCKRHPRRHEVLPVKVHAGAFGDGLPCRDLRLSPDHAVFVADVLMPIKYLINGATIVQEHVPEVTYFHVELPDHEVIFAEGMPAESYLDLGNRSVFENGGSSVQLHPDLASRLWDETACAPLIFGGPLLAAIRLRLAVQALWLGHSRTDDPDLRVKAAGKIIEPERLGEAYRYLLPPRARVAHVQSRTFVPTQMQADADDTRRYGVSVRALLLDRKSITLDDPRLTAGWHAPTPAGRWTDGVASIKLSGEREIIIHLAERGTYWADRRGSTRRAA